jgi:hypothetical protein
LKKETAWLSLEQKHNECTWNASHVKQSSNAAVLACVARMPLLGTASMFLLGSGKLDFLV